VCTELTHKGSCVPDGTLFVTCPFTPEERRDLSGQ
jgi:hypothetical protein